MKNRIVILFALILSSFISFSQNNQLTIEGAGGKFYLRHTVVAKENWYSIGRLFNLSPRDIAAYNNLSIDKPLDIAQQLIIPLTATNFDQKELNVPGETLIPVYHEVGDKEWAYKLSSIYNDVPVTSLERWNKIKRDDVNKGMSLIVGFLRVKTDLSPLAVGVSSNPAVGTTTTGMAAQPVNKSATTQALPNSGPSATVIPVSNTSEHVNNYAVTHSNGGFFNADYAGGSKSASGIAGTFKSTSGWSDGKYYVLMNGVSVGTIVRVAGANGKAIYAKVLGQLPEMKESAGLLVRISNAASAELGLGEGKFPVDIKY